MALAIKLRPTGKKHQRYFRVVVAERKSKLQGKYTDDLGWLNPHTNGYGLDKERVKKWIGSGALPTDTAHNLLVRAGVIQGPKVPVHSKKIKNQVAGGASKGWAAEAARPEVKIEAVPGDQIVGETPEGKVPDGVSENGETETEEMEK